MNELQNISIPQSIAEIEEYLKQNRIQHIVGDIIEVALYIRVSRDEQVKYGYSIDSQKERLIEYCKQMGYKVVAIYVDEGKSARSKIHRRKEFIKLLNDAHQKKFSRIVIWRLDRWIRNVKDYYKVQEILDANGVTWECSDERYETNTAMGRYVLNLKLSDAQNESDKTSERIKFNFENMVRCGRPIYGSHSLPVGYKVEGEKKDKKVVKDKDNEKATIDMFKTMKSTGSIRQTSIFLNENYPYRNWEYETVQRALKNKLYCGIYRGVPNYCEPYITIEEHEEILKMIKRNSKDNSKQHDYIFKGLIRCCSCHRLMSGNTHKYALSNGDIVETYSYRCGKHCGSSMCTNSHGVNQEKLEVWLMDNFFKEINKYVLTTEELKDSTKPKVDVTKKLEKLNNRKERLNELYLDGRIDREKYDKDYSSIITEIASLTQSQEITEEIDLSKFKEILNNKSALDLYKQLDATHKRMFWFEYIDYIEQDEENEFKIFFK